MPAMQVIFMNECEAMLHWNSGKRGLHDLSVLDSIKSMIHMYSKFLSNSNNLIKTDPDLCPSTPHELHMAIIHTMGPTIDLSFS